MVVKASDTNGGLAPDQMLPGEEYVCELSADLNYVIFVNVSQMTSYPLFPF